MLSHFFYPSLELSIVVVIEKCGSFLALNSTLKNVLSRHWLASPQTTSFGIRLSRIHSQRTSPGRLVIGVPAVDNNYSFKIILL